jgi:uncharacterized protein YqeY
MPLLDQLQDDMKQAMKSRDELKLSTIRMLRSAISYAKIEKGSELTEEDVINVLLRAAKQRRESVEGAEKAGRTDIAQREGAELQVIQDYLPAQLSESEIEKIVRDAISKVGAVDMKDRGKLMGAVMQEVRGKADGKLVGQIVEKALSG